MYENFEHTPDGSPLVKPKCQVAQGKWSWGPSLAGLAEMRLDEAQFLMNLDLLFRMKVGTRKYNIFIKTYEIVKKILILLKYLINTFFLKQ